MWVKQCSKISFKVYKQIYLILWFHLLAAYFRYFYNKPVYDLRKAERAKWVGLLLENRTPSGEEAKSDYSHNQIAPLFLKKGMNVT